MNVNTSPSLCHLCASWFARDVWRNIKLFWLIDWSIDTNFNFILQFATNMNFQIPKSSAVTCLRVGINTRVLSEIVSLSSGKRILKICWDLTKLTLPPWVWWHSFLEHGVLGPHHFCYQTILIFGYYNVCITQAKQEKPVLILLIHTYMYIVYIHEIRQSLKQCSSRLSIQDFSLPQITFPWTPTTLRSCTLCPLWTYTWQDSMRTTSH